MPVPISPWDLALLRLINSWRQPFLDVLMPIFSDVLVAWVLGVLLLLLLLCRKKWGTLPQTIVLALALIISDQGCNLIKQNTDRMRPKNVLAGVFVYDSDKQSWRQNPPSFNPAIRKGNSFPSSHAANSMTATILLMLFLPWSRPWLALLPLLVGYSRVYLGHHYPGDVLAGWLFGAVVGGLFLALWPYILDFLSRRSLLIKNKLRT